MNKEEKCVVIERGVARLGLMAKEAQWALGLPTGSDFVPPPTWVRRVIQLRFGVDPDRVVSGEKIDPLTARKALGAFVGLAEGAALVLRPGEPAPADSSTNTLSEERLRHMISAHAKPHLEKYDQNVDAVRQIIRAGNAAEFAAFSATQSEVANAIAAEEAEPGSTGDMTQDLLDFIWMYWPEIPQMGSVHKLHKWITDLNYLHCSEKLVEKVCRRVELRLSEFGAEKRPPTN